MAYLTDISLLKGLQNLLKPESDSDSDDLPGPSENSGRPIPSKKEPYDNPYRPVTPEKAQYEDFSVDSEDLSALTLISPEYEMIYKQRVNTEDVFLQIGNKSPATFSCEDLVVRVNLRGDQTASASQMQLDIEERAIKLQTRKYKLHLPLPHPVDPDQGAAKWDAEQETLTITLRMKRDLDFCNF